MEVSLSLRLSSRYVLTWRQDAKKKTRDWKMRSKWLNDRQPTRVLQVSSIFTGPGQKSACCKLYKLQVTRLRFGLSNARPQCHMCNVLPFYVRHGKTIKNCWKKGTNHDPRKPKRVARLNFTFFSPCFSGGRVRQHRDGDHHRARLPRPHGPRGLRHPRGHRLARDWER